jgi:hypothetical protein
MPDSAPLIKTISETVPGQATAGTDDAWNVGEAPFAGTVTEVTFASEATITGHADNHRVLSLINKGQSGAGTTVIATLTTTADVVADDETTIALSEVEDATTVAAGDILEWNSNAVASGVADPGGLVQVKISRS